MAGSSWRRWGGEIQELSLTAWSIIFLVAIGSVVGIAILAPTDHVGPGHPQAEWNWETSNGAVVLTHEGGDTVDRDAIQLRGDALNTPITDLGDAGDNRITEAFENKRVSEGDSIVLEGAALQDGSLLLYWTQPDGPYTATLAQVEYED